MEKETSDTAHIPKNKLAGDREDISEFVERMKAREDVLQKLHPPVPDGSGDFGTWDKEASEWFGRNVYSTAGGRYFFWIEAKKKGKIIDPDLIPASLT